MIDMNLRFIKLANYWFYWWPDYEGDPSDLLMVNGADALLESLGNMAVYVRAFTEEPDYTDIYLTKLEEDEYGATYKCISEKYNDKVWICPVILQVFGNYPETIYLKLV